MELRAGPSRFALERVGDAFRVGAETAWFRASFEEHLDAEEIGAWAAGLRQLHSDQSSAHIFRAHRSWLQVTIAMGKKGELHVSILLQNAPDYLDEVRMFLNLDQRDLPTIADQIADLANP